MASQTTNLWVRYTVIMLIFCTFIHLTTSASFADTYKIDNAHSSIRFSINHLGFSYTTGRFDNIDGIFSFNEKRELSSAKAKIFVKTNSINTNHKKRDDLLKGFSFFNIKKHPIAMFKATTINRDAENEKTGTITGKLTMMGETHTETFNLKFIGEGRDPWLGYRMGFNAKGIIQRSNYNLNFMEGAIGNDVTLEIFIEAIKQ
ncbi:MAG: YceI family protein [Pseudomonadales bacterium]|nr:YceI family protein [Pseudomonadales bacterium]